MTNYDSHELNVAGDNSGVLPYRSEEKVQCFRVVPQGNFDRRLLYTGVSVSEMLNL